MEISEFIIKDVRCFEGEQKFNIRPLTFLIGENSTGKSTVLGCFQTLSDFVDGVNGRKNNPDFNFPPYEMGGFDDIARKTGSTTSEYLIGFDFVGDEDEVYQYLITFCKKTKTSEPYISKIEWQFSDGKITYNINEEPSESLGEVLMAVSHIKNNEFVTNGDVILKYGLGLGFELKLSSDILQNIPPWQTKDKKKLDDIKKFKSFLERKSYEFFPNGYRDARSQNKSLSIAPVRSEPQRTYNPLNETHSPQGKEIPVLLTNLKQSDPASWNKLKEQLEVFGQSSGLFTNIDVRNFTQSTNDPFQLQITINGTVSNLMDVGYGVSQALPILVHIFTKERTRILMQQPEVHLHPKGQAALASLLVNSVKEKENSFIIETHSDYMIDRVRVEIMKGNIAPEDVSLIYLESADNKTIVHNIKFDKQANLIDVPNGYRDFFLKEADTLLGF